MKTSNLLLSVGAAALCALSASGATVIKPASLTVSGAASLFTEQNIINGSGLSAPLNTGDNLPAGVTHTWGVGVSTDSWVSTDPGGFPADWFAASGTIPTFVFDLGADVAVDAAHFWTYGGGSGVTGTVQANAAKTVELRFNTAAQGNVTFSGPAVPGTLNHGPLFGEPTGSVLPQLDVPLGASVTARYVELRITDNWYVAPGDGSSSDEHGHPVRGGDRVGLGEVRFSSTPATVVINCPGNIVTNCTGGLTPVSFTVTATGPSPGTVVTCVPPSGTGFGPGTSTVVCTAVNGGSSASCSFTVTVRDTVPPVLVGLPTGGSFQCLGDVPPLATVTATDNCDGAIPVTTTCTTNGSCPMIITCTWRAQDSVTNSVSATRTFTVLDTVPPVLVGVPAGGNFQCPGDVPPLAAVTATDNCDGAIPVTTLFTTNGSCPMVITCTWSARDRCTNSVSATRTFTVLDTIPPVLAGVPAGGNFQCPGDVPPLAAVTATDNCDGAIPVTTLFTTNGSCPMVITCTWRAQDRCTNSVSATRTFTVLDTIPPVISCPSSFTNLSTGGGSAIVTFTVPASDNCIPNIPVVCTPPSGSSFPIGDTRVTCSAIDACTNSATCSFTVTVIDRNECPVAVAKVRPGCELFPGQTTTVVIAGNNSNACVALDGTMSSDPDGDALTFAWFLDGGGVPVAAGATAGLCLGVGAHSLTLVVDDGRCTSNAVVEVEVITPCEAIEELIYRVESAHIDRQRKRPLIATLKAACASYDRENCVAAANQLEAFRNKVRAQLERSHPAEAAEFIALARRILDCIDCPGTAGH